MLFLLISLVQSFSMQFPTGLPHAICLWYEDASNWIRPECSDKTNVVKEQQRPAFEGIVTDIIIVIIVIITIIFFLSKCLLCAPISSKATHCSSDVALMCFQRRHFAQFSLLYGRKWLVQLREGVRPFSIMWRVCDKKKISFSCMRKKKHKLIWDDQKGGGSRLELGWWIGVVSAFGQRQIWAGKPGNAPTQQLVWTWGCERRGTVLWNSTASG